MYHVDGVSYTEDHSVSFGSLVTRSSDGVSYTDFADTVNTWTTWHLIPSSRHAIAHPTYAAKFIEIPGADGMLDLTTYLTGKPVFGMRQGTLSFYVVNGFQNWETLRMEMVRFLHGKRLKMRLMDDPAYYYEGRYMVGNWETGQEYSSISINYQLDPYKMHIGAYGSYPLLWDPFNFETDYDYSVVMYPNIEVDGTAKTFIINAGDHSFTPIVTWVSGSVTVSFGGVTRTITSGSATLGPSSNGSNTLTVSGTGSVRITWNGGML